MAEIRTTYSKAEVSKLLKIGRSGMDLIMGRAEMEGCVVKRGLSGSAMQIDLAEFVRLRTAIKVAAASPKKAASALSYESARAEMTAANAELRQLELSRLKGETVTVDDALRETMEHVGDFKLIFANLPQQVANAILGDVPQPIAEKVQQIVDDTIDAAFDRLQKEFAGPDPQALEDMDFG